jgi:hypothetical protein
MGLKLWGQMIEMSIANQEDLDEEREGEEEIRRLRKAMETMSPDQRALYEIFLRSYWPKVLRDLKEETKNK